jgi:hypothetical protein
MPQFLQIFRTESAIDYSMIATHRNRHAMADHHLIAVVNNWDFCDFAYG